MPINDHDDIVLKVGQDIEEFGTVHADIDSAYVGRHAFESQMVLPVMPEYLLSAFIPTQAIFSKRVAFPNPDWKEPDLAVKQGRFVYVLDVHDANDNFTSVARKIETVVANAMPSRIVGMALVSKTKRKTTPYVGKLAELNRLRSTFHLLFGKSSTNSDTDDCRTYLKELFSHKSFRHVHGTVRWDRILSLDVTQPDWSERLHKHIDHAFESQLLMTEAPLTT